MASVLSEIGLILDRSLEVIMIFGLWGVDCIVLVKLGQ